MFSGVIRRYHRLRERLPAGIFARWEGGSWGWTEEKDPYVIIGTNFWGKIDPDRWGEVEKVVSEYGEKLLRLVDE